MEQSKNQKFRRLASSRTGKITDELRKIGNLASRTNYEYSDEEIETLFSFLQERLDEAREMFKGDRPMPKLSFD